MEGKRCRRGPDLCRMTGEDPLMIGNEGIGKIRVSKNSNYWYREKTSVGVLGTPFSNVCLSGKVQRIYLETPTFDPKSP